MEAFSALVLILGALTCVSASAIIEQQRDGSVQYMNRQQAELASIQSVDNMQKMDKGFKLDMINSASLSQSQSDSSDSISPFGHGVGHGPQNREPFSRLSINENDPIGVSSQREMVPASIGKYGDVSLNMGDEPIANIAMPVVDKCKGCSIGDLKEMEASESKRQSSLGGMSSDDDFHGTRRLEWGTGGGGGAAAGAMPIHENSYGFQLSPDSTNMKQMGSFQGFEPARNMLESSGMS